MDTIDDHFNFLQNKTIKSVSADFDGDKTYLVFLLSDGSYAYISGSDNGNSLYLAIEKHIIN